ncbi:MAG: YciI family protein [Pseudomonadota bacterium]
MKVALICKDKPGHLQTRIETREAHLAYAAETGVTQMAGPMLDDGGRMCGSLIILNVADLAAAVEWAANDPYAKAGLFEDVMIREWKQVV